MCSIYGIIQFGKGVDGNIQNKLNRMSAITKHRGPDQSDVVVLGQSAIGMNRLSIIAPGEHSTVQSNKDQQYAVCNGEIVNHKSLRRQLKQLPANQRSDSAVILPLFHELGPDFVKQLAGMFAIAIYDHRANVLRLWRDPLGIKPLYYYHSDSCVIFASEIKAIYAVLDHTPRLDFGAIDHTLRYRFHPGRSSVFPEIKRVLPGEVVTFKDGKISRQHYWKLGSNQTSADPTVSTLEFRSLLEQVVNENAQADVTGGFFTSGGLDSSLITSIALRAEGSPYRQPISIKFQPRSVVDEEYGKLLEKYFKTPFEWVTISDATARQALTELIPFMDEPLENPTHIGTYLMAERAHELGVKSVLTGDGSDEFFLGYDRHARWFTDSNAARNYPKEHWAVTPTETEELYTAEAKTSVTPMLDGFEHTIEPFSGMDQALSFERWERLPEYHSMRLDRMTMAHGVEAKVPLQDHRIVEYSLRLPAHVHHGSSGKEWLQKVAEPWLPSAILHRPKVPFPNLPNQWLSGVGAKWAAEILLDSGAHTRKWIRPRVLERYLAEHRDGTQLHGRSLWALIVLELWLQDLASWRSPF
jgi:asparagine synthase (glutamine-hydrolysing)